MGKLLQRHRTPPDPKGWLMERELTLNETVALLKDRNAKAREAITALTAEIAELREENTRLKTAHSEALDEISRPGAMVYPVLVGGGILFFPQRERRVDLELVETRTFSSRVVYLRYRVAR